MSKFLTDEEILEQIESAEVRELVRERLDMKDKHRNWINVRLQEAANIIGHNVISESVMYD